MTIAVGRKRGETIQSLSMPPQMELHCCIRSATIVRPLHARCPVSGCSPPTVQCFPCDEKLEV